MTSGPIIKPIGPINIIAPKIESKMKSEGISVPLETMYGLMTLSIVATNKKCQSNRPTAANVCPHENR